MTVRLIAAAWLLCAGLVAGPATSFAQVAAPPAPVTAPPSQPTPPTQQQAAPPANAGAPAVAAPAAQAVPQVNTAEITKRANQAVGLDIDATVKSWNKSLDRIEEGLRGEKLRYAELNAFREDLEKARGQVKGFWDKLQPRLNELKAQVDRLGPPPVAGQPPEPDQAALNRAELNYHFGIFQAAQKSVDAGFFRIEQLVNTIQDVRRKNFTNNLLQPVPGVFSLDTWRNVPVNTINATGRLTGLIEDWWKGVKDQDELFRFAIEAALLWLVLTIVRLRGVSRIRRWTEAGEPPFWKRASSAAGVILLRCAPVVLPPIFLYYSADAAQAFPERIGWLFYFAIRSVIVIFAVNALITTVVSPGQRQWRLIPASDDAARRICFLVLTLAVVYGVSNLIYMATRLVQAPFSLTVVSSFPASLLFAWLVIAIMRTPLNAAGTEDLPSLSWLKVLKLPILLLTLAVIVSALGGYLALSRFIAQQLLVTGTILALVYLLLLWVDGFAQSMGDENTSAGGWLEGTLGLDERRRQQLSVPTSLLLKFGVLVCAVPLIMLQWGYAWPDIIDWYRQVFFGFHIGSTQVSIAAIVASIIVFVLGYFAAQLFQGWLDTQILKPAGLSGGVRDSIRTGVGYIGVFVAALAAFSYAGFNLSNLAIVAGAFSVGIGFGLQSVVSNFVSGLILLAERPIKVGDLVVVGGEEGYVRKISVRSTEIETFDRAHVLIPNSFFITEKVKNWTLRNNTGRVTISVGVAYGCDPRAVKTILLKAAKDHPNVMISPEPFVDFEEFGADTLNFKLYAFIYNLKESTATRTDLRIAILDAFNAAGIVIPSRQTEISVRDMDWLKTAVTQYMSQAGGSHLSGNGSAKAPPSKGHDDL